MSRKQEIKVGDKVALTGKFLKSTGQHKGFEANKEWLVVGFWGEGRFAFVDEPPAFPEMFADLAEDDPARNYRSIAVGNLYKVGTLTSRNDP